MLATIIFTLILIVGIYIMATQEHLGIKKQRICIIAICLLILLTIAMYITLPESVSEYIFSMSSIAICLIIFMFTIREGTKKQKAFMVAIVFGIISTLTAVVQWVGSITHGMIINAELTEISVNLTFLVAYAIILRRRMHTDVLAPKNCTSLCVSLRNMIN